MDGSSMRIMLRMRHQRSSHGKHLLLAAGQVYRPAGLSAPPDAGTARTPLSESSLDLVLVISRIRTQLQVLQNRQALRTLGVPSGTWAIPSDTILCPGIWVISVSFKGRSFLLSAAIRPVMVCRVVVFPAPLAPISAMTSPLFTSKEIPLMCTGSRRNTLPDLSLPALPYATTLLLSQICGDDSLDR